MTVWAGTGIRALEKSKLIAYVELLVLFAVCLELCIDMVNDFITVCVYVKGGRKKRAGLARVSSRVASTSQKPRCIPHCPVVSKTNIRHV